MIGIHVRAALIAIGMAVALLAGGSALAEVGVALTEDGSSVPYIVGVTDDLDPIKSSVWEPMGSSNSRRIRLNPQGAAQHDGAPSMTIHPGSGMAVAAWAHNTGDGYDVVISVFAGQSWAAPITVAGSADAEHDPFLLADRNSEVVHLLYWVDGASPGVFHRESTDLAAWSDAVRVSQPGETAVRPSAAIHGSELLVSYESHSLGLGQVPRQIVLARRSVDGFSTEVVTSTSCPEPNRPEVHSDSAKIWIEWVDSEASMGWLKQTSPGAWEPLRLEQYVDFEDRDFHARARVRMAVRER